MKPFVYYIAIAYHNHNIDLNNRNMTFSPNRAALDKIINLYPDKSFVNGQVKHKFTCAKDKCLKKLMSSPDPEHPD